MSNKSKAQTKVPSSLIPFFCQFNGPGQGEMKQDEFWVLAELGRLKNPRVLNALEAYLVHGRDRDWACGMYGISVSYFSQRLKVIHRTWMLTEVLRAVSHTDEHEKPKIQGKGNACG